MEEWKSIKDYEGLYEVSNMGRVKSLNYRNSGIEKIYIRNDKEKYTEINVNDFITNDESLKGILGY